MFTYTCHTWTHPFGFDMGFAFAAFFLHCFYMQYKNEKIDYRVLLLSVLSMLMCTGLKAPVAAVTIVAAGVVCFGWLVKKQFRLAFTYGFSLLLAFGIVMVFCVGFTKSSDSSVGGFSVWHNIRESTEFLRITYDRIPAGIPEFLKVATMLLVFIFGSNMLVFGVCFVSGTVSLFDRRMWTTQVLGLLLSAATGTFLGAFNVQDGSSQMYFLMSALIPSMAVGLIWLENEYDGWGKIGKCCVSVVLTGFLAAQVLAMLALDFTYWGNGLENAFRLGYINLFCKDKAQQDFRIDGLQRDNVEALKWIRENTPEDSIVLSDRSVVGDMSQYMYYGVFSERQAYLEGDVYYRQRFVEERDQMRSIIGRVYQNDVSALKEAIDDGVDYVVQTKWLTPDFVPDLEWIKLVFSSESINVYEVINQE